MNLEAVLAEANDPATPGARLRALASHPNPAVRQAVAQNPNLPEEVLLQLAVHFPETVLSNDLLDLLLLVNPNWLAEIPEHARNALLGCEAAPAGFLRWAAQNCDANAQQSLLRNPKAPLEAVEGLLHSPVVGVYEAAQMHTTFDSEPLPAALWWADMEGDGFELRQMVLAGLQPGWLAPRLVREADTLLRQSLAHSPHSSADVLEALLFDEDEEVRSAARQNPAVSAKSLGLLNWLEAPDTHQRPADLPPLEVLAKGHVWIRQMVARNPRTPPETLLYLATDDDWRVRQAVAQNPTLPSSAFPTLLADLDRDVRQALAARPDAPAGVLLRLIADEHEEVRQTAAANPACPREALELFERASAQDAALSPEALRQLSQQGEWARRLAASHPNAPLETLERCRQEGDWHTRLAVANNPKAPASVLQSLGQDSDPEVRQAVAQHPHTPLATLEALLTDEQPDVRVRLAHNPVLSLEWLVQLSKDDHWKVRQAVAENPRTPAEVLCALAQDSDRDVRQAVADNPAVPEAALEPLFGGWLAGLKAPLGALELYRRATSGQSLPPELLEQLAQGNDWAKRLAAKHSHTPDPRLWNLATDEDWRVRQAVAQNPALSPELAERLAQDPDVDVRRAIATHPISAEQTLERLAVDEQQDVRLHVARHPGASSFALGYLLGDEDETVRQAARQHPKAEPQSLERMAQAESFDPLLPPAFLEQLAYSTAWGRALAAQNPSLSEHLLGTLAQDSDWQVRGAAAKNPQATPELLQQLSQDSDRDVRIAVASHPRTPQAVLLALLADYDEMVRLAAIRNPSLELTALERYRQRLMVQASRSAYGLNRALALTQPQMPVSELSKRRHWMAPQWVVRYALTQNPATPRAVLERLAQDGNRRVRAAALGALSMATEPPCPNP